MKVFQKLICLVDLQVVDLFVKNWGLNTFFTSSIFTFAGYRRGNVLKLLLS